MWTIGRLFHTGCRLNRFCWTSFQSLSQMTSENNLPNLAVKKREVYDDDDDELPSAKKPKISNEVEPKIEVPLSVVETTDSHKAKLKKMVILLSYSGKDYLGMQRNPGVKTIEEDLLQALYKSGTILRDHYDSPQLIYFQRAARTDKGVSAVRQIVSLKLPAEEVHSLPEKINQHLPPQIRVFAVRRTTKSFNCKLTCDARTYAYMLPTFAFTPIGEIASELYRIPSSRIEEVNKFLQLYVGTHNYYNFTSGRKADDPSCKRYMISCQCGEPFVKDGIEFAVIKVKGQSFMLHQIRKMIGLAIAVIRNLATEDTLKKSWSSEKLDIPIAPGLGLMLEEVHYDKYNRRYGGDGIHEPLIWDGYQDAIHKFREEQIYPTIIETEKKEKSMLNWLGTLFYHTFDVRNSDTLEFKDNKINVSNPEVINEEQILNRAVPEADSSASKEAVQSQDILKTNIVADAKVVQTVASNSDSAEDNSNVHNSHS